MGPDDVAHPLAALLVCGGHGQVELAVAGLELAPAELELDVAAVVAERRVDLVAEVLAELAHVRDGLLGRDRGPGGKRGGHPPEFSRARSPASGPRAGTDHRPPAR